MRVLIAEGDTTLRSALRLLLTNDDSVELVGEACSTDELMELLAQARADVVLVDWNLPGWCPGRINGQFTSVRLVGLDGRPERRDQILAEGAHAFFSKLESPDLLLRVLSGTPRYDPS
ncbi:MAG TPA: response regulator [Chloroflexota bacterium]